MIFHRSIRKSVWKKTEGKRWESCQEWATEIEKHSQVTEVKRYCFFDKLFDLPILMVIEVYWLACLHSLFSVINFECFRNILEYFRGRKLSYATNYKWSHLFIVEAKRERTKKIVSRSNPESRDRVYSFFCQGNSFLWSSLM